MKKLLASAVALALTGAGAVAVTAQEPAPTVGVSIAKSSMTLTGADALRPAPTRFEVKSSGRGERGFAVFKLKPGFTRDEVAQAVRRIQDPNDSKKYGTFVASGFVQGSQAYVTTITLTEAEYVLIDFTKKPAVRTG